MACISENITESPEFKKLVDKIGLSETVRDYLENNKIRPLEEIKISKPELFKLDDTNELSKNNKVLAINTLFNENESLANAVYESLGFKTSGLQTFKDNLIGIIGVDKVKELYADTDVEFNSFIIDDVELGTDKSLIITIKTDKGQRTAINLRLDGDYQQLKISEGGKTIRGIYAPLSEKKTAIDFLISEFKNLDTQEITPQQKQEAQSKFQEYINATGKQDIEGFKQFVHSKVLDELPNEDWKNINNESDNPLDCI